MGALDDLEGITSQILGKTGRMTAGGVASLADMARPVSDPVYTGLGYLARGTGFPHTADILFGAANAPTNAEIAQKYYDSITQGKYTPRNNFESIIDAIGQMGVGAMTPTAIMKGYKAFEPSGIWADEAGSIGGIKAKTADKQKLALAQKMDESGSTPKQIWDETGWFKGHDNQWRFEIPDENAKFVGQYGTGKMGQFLEHPELYEAYPDLKNVDVSYTGKGDTYYNKLADRIRIGSTADVNPKSASTHELTHAIQGREGMQAGGMPMPKPISQIDTIKPLGHDVYNTFTSLPQEIRKDASQWIKSQGSRAKWIDLMNNPNEDTAEFVEYLHRYAIENKIPELEKSAYTWINAYDRTGNTDIQDIARRRQAIKEYLKIPGEVEARTVEHRMNYVPDQRKKIPFMEDYNYYLDLANEGKPYE